MDIDTTNVGDTWNSKHKLGGLWTKEELNNAKMYGIYSDILFAKSKKENLSQNAFGLIHSLLLQHPNQRAITYKDFYCIRYLKKHSFPFGNKLRRELEEKGFIQSHEDVGKVGEIGQSVGDICELTYITEAIPCE